MPTPFACSPQYTQDIDDNYLMPIQVGSDQTEEGGLPQMKHIKFGLLKEYFKQNLSTLGTFRGVYTSALPDNLAVNDFFFAGATFTVDALTFTIGNYYQYDVDGNWGEISLILSGVLTTASIVDDLITQATDKALSANMGYEIQLQINALGLSVVNGVLCQTFSA